MATGCVLAAILACLGEIGRMYLANNRHVVDRGWVYRSAQPNRLQMTRYVREDGIRTVVCLRGMTQGGRAPAWAAQELADTQFLGLCQENVTLSPHRLPAPGELRRLIEVFDRAEYPILLHCRHGADRTGLAAAMYLLLHTEADLPSARRQCSPRFGHVGIGKAGFCEVFFDQYEEWLLAHGATHSPAGFRRWIDREYCPGQFRARLELMKGPSQVETGRPIVFTVRAHNTSRETWQYRAGSQVGVYAWYAVTGPNGETVFSNDAGRFDRTVPPGGAIDLELPVPSLSPSGRYRLYVDLHAQSTTFRQYGSEPLTHDWEAHAPARVGGR